MCVWSRDVVHGPEDFRAKRGLGIMNRFVHEPFDNHHFRVRQALLVHEMSYVIGFRKIKQEV